MASKSDFAETLQSNTCFQSVLGFFFNKGVRGGPRVLLNLAAVLVGLFIFLKLLPARMTESALQRIPRPETVWSGLSGGAGQSGGLRIVVFGELDIGTPVGANPEDEDPKSWTEMLCDQVSCIDNITLPSIIPVYTVYKVACCTTLSDFECSLSVTRTLLWSLHQTRPHGPSAPTNYMPRESITYSTRQTAQKAPARTTRISPNITPRNGRPGT